MKMTPFVIMVGWLRAGQIMIKDWFHKESLSVDISEIKDEILPMFKDQVWSPCDYDQAPGSEWILLHFQDKLIRKLELGTGYEIYPDFYIWNYREIKTLKIHKDTNTPGDSRQIVGVIPLIGDFEVNVYDDSDLSKPIDSCSYGPGDFLILNNTKYYHGGRVLSETRVSLHFYFNFYNHDNEHLDNLLRKNRIN